MLKKIFIFLLIIITFNVGVNLVLAQTAPPGISGSVTNQMNTLKGVGLPDDSPLNLTVKIIRILLSTLALIFIILIIYGGVRWMTSAGNAEGIESAKKIMSAAIIGIIIVFLAYAITALVFNVIMKA